jgi:hypothetical protein
VRSISIVPDFGQVPAGRLGTFDYRAFTTRLKSDLAAAGVDEYFLCLDVSLNHVKGNRQGEYWQLHAWGVIEDPRDRIDVLKRQIEQLINASDAVDKPVKISKAPLKPSSIRSVMAYAMMSEFDRREWFRKSRPGRRPFWDTQDRPLLGLPLVELLASTASACTAARSRRASTSRPFNALAPFARHDNAPDAGGRSTVLAARRKVVPAADRLASRQTRADACPFAS